MENMEKAIILSIVDDCPVATAQGPIQADATRGLVTLYYPRPWPSSPWIARRTFSIALSAVIQTTYLRLQSTLLNAHNVTGDAIDYGDYQTPRYLALRRVDDAKKALRHFVTE